MTNTKILTNMPVSKIIRLSKLFPPISIPPKAPPQAVVDSSTNCYKQLLEYGYIRSPNVGMHTLLPLGVRVLDKLKSLVENEMTKIGAQRILLPSLTSSDLWKKTERYNVAKTELFIMRDRHKREYILGPTYEEAICELLKSVGSISVKMLPIRLYQISKKWRDEIKPRLGFMRSKEFIMKDLYTFDDTLDDAKYTYDLVCKAYNNIFQQLGISFIKAVGDTGTIGGIMSHEYHYICNVGEDVVLECSLCNKYINKNICKESICTECGNAFTEHKTIEVGHVFLLNTLYSEQLNAFYQGNSAKSFIPFAMGCYGLGLTRIMAAAVQILSTSDGLKWPECIAPYTVCIIPPKAGSKEEPGAKHIDYIAKTLSQLNIDAIIDDRINITIGKRLLHARCVGYVYALVIGKSAVKETPLFEIIDLRTLETLEVTLEGISNHFNSMKKSAE